jgi:hypothetical protein
VTARRCILCDGAAVAKLVSVEAALAMTAMVALVSESVANPAVHETGIEVFKAGLCGPHRGSWVMLLLRGGQSLDRLHAEAVAT